MERDKLLISFSGGETSAFMTQWLWKNMQDKFEMIIVFANTGYENEETLNFIHTCSQYYGYPVYWVESIFHLEKGKGVTPKIVNFSTASRNAEPFRSMIEKYGIPNKNFPHCSRELKERVIRSFARTIGWKSYYTAIGIRSDEIDRMSENRKEKRLIYPLVGLIPMTKPDINEYWRAMPFRLHLKGYQGNCRACWKKSLRKLLTIAAETPDAFQPFYEMEKEFENFIPRSRSENRKVQVPIRFFRDNLSVADILEMAKEKFERAKDDSIEYTKQISLFGHELDTPSGCSESCEAF